jgi:1-deoxy-D-xylulose-5-phosphate synthase
MDLSFLRCVPNMTVMAAADENECRQMLYTGFTLGTPVAVRYPRGTGAGVAIQPRMEKIKIGQAKIIRKGAKIAILSFGSPLEDAKIAAQTMDATVVNMRFVKPLDENTIKKMQQEHDLIVTVEDNVIKGGAGSGVNEFLNQIQSPVKVLNLGLPDHYQDHGSREDLLTEAGIDSEGIITQIMTFLNIKQAKKNSKIVDISSNKN